MNQKLEQFVGKSVAIDIVNMSEEASHAVTGLLAEVNNYGVLISGGKGLSETFATRFFPWTRIEHIDLNVAARSAAA